MQSLILASYFLKTNRGALSNPAAEDAYYTRHAPRRRSLAPIASVAVAVGVAVIGAGLLG
jgi:hypothetical protein